MVKTATHCHVLLQMYLEKDSQTSVCVCDDMHICSKLRSLCASFTRATCNVHGAWHRKKNNNQKTKYTNYKNIWKCCNLRWKTYYKNWKRQLSEWVWTLNTEHWNTVAIWVSTNFYLFEIELVTIACFGICLTLSVELLVFGVWFGTFYQTEIRDWCVFVRADGPFVVD